MAMICKKCGGLIPDITYGNFGRLDCKNHRKRKGDLPFKRYR